MIIVKLKSSVASYDHESLNQVEKF